MSRSTRVHTIRRHLVQGGIIDLGLDKAALPSDPAQHPTDGFAARQYVDENRTLLVIVGAYGPDWFGTVTQIQHRLEQPYVKCHVSSDAPMLALNEVLVRWATSEELQARKAAQEERQAPLKSLLRRAAAAQRAEEERQALEAAGQSGLF